MTKETRGGAVLYRSRAELSQKKCAKRESVREASDPNVPVCGCRREFGAEQQCRASCEQWERAAGGRGGLSAITPP